MTGQEQHSFDTLVRSVEMVSASVYRCSALWLGLVSGELEIIEALAQEQHSVLLVRGRAVPVRPLGARACRILERTLLGESRKVIAYESNVAASTLAFSLKESLLALGLRCRPSLVPSSLVVLVHAACRSIVPVGAFIGDGEHEGRPITVFTHALEETILRGLSPSERAVVSLVASGRSNVDIAARRNRSCRTVVNQIAAACRRLGVSGRLELLHRFATLGVSAPQES